MALQTGEPSTGRHRDGAEPRDLADPGVLRHGMPLAPSKVTTESRRVARPHRWQYSKAMKRLQRLRASAPLRDMTSESGFGVSHLIQPLFLSAAATKEEPLDGLPGTSRHTLASL